MKRTMGLALAATVLGAGALAGCTTTGKAGPVEVTRFHLGAPLETGTLTVEAMPGRDQDSLEYKTYAAAVETEALTHGFTVPATGAAPQYAAVVSFTRTNRPAPSPNGSRSGVSVGLGGGGGGYGGGVGLGGAISFPIGKPRYRTIVLTDLAVQIRRRSDGTVIWEGHAQTTADGQAPDAQTGPAATKLARALFLGFPGESGRTITVK
ncbi:MAG: DUF4136 domain-containing protein [Sphingomonas sp.]|uniref:DUF4136 domain-containing protein n=1 Tax=unclassified Sphingomonas TaxID=196159 RepID=UPI0021AF28A6|nr:DUF4136 domain-containing protein [Sphingomonas sp. TF3]